ncbi:hypothetical protein TNCV_3300651 [Trichonephila clavipes]|nr:hypothetical protein TNCV_3300651 [Trichonephila clavipes]
MTSVAMNNTTVQQPLSMVSPNLNPTIMMLKAEAVSVSKYNVVPFRCPNPPFIAPSVEKCLCFPVKGKRSNGRLVDILLCCKMSQMAWRTPNDA